MDIFANNFNFVWLSASFRRPNPPDAGQIYGLLGYGKSKEIIDNQTVKKLILFNKIKNLKILCQKNQENQENVHNHIVFGW